MQQSAGEPVLLTNGRKQEQQLMMMLGMSCFDEFAILKPRVEARLRSLLAEMEAYAVTSEAAEVHSPLAQLRAVTLRGGRRLRSGLLLAAVEAVTSWREHETAVVDAAAALEMFQSYLLIHDDWMDDQSIRRGGQTIHVALSLAGYSAHTAASAAILLGDLANALAVGLLFGESTAPANMPRLLSAFVGMQRDAALGQLLELIQAPKYEIINQLKTASYSVSGPLRIGIAIANGTTELEEALIQYAQPLGVAYQLRDDLSDLYGDNDGAGTATGVDLRNGVVTAPVAQALGTLPPAERAELKGLIGCSDPGAASRAGELVEQSGARAAVEQRIDDLRRSALAALEGQAMRPAGRAQLARFVDLITTLQ
jgi:geranylgeranyl diphosphate synthase type I